jgi:putative holliday junction resolvase
VGETSCRIPSMRTLGVDYGKARIGLAVTDETGMFSFPHKVLKGNRNLRARFAEVIEEKNIGKIVMGNPLRTDGTVGDASREVERVAELMRGWFGLEVVLWDERYTSAQASEAARKSGPASEKGKNDLAAATIILRSYIDHVLMDKS